MYLKELIKIVTMKPTLKKAYPIMLPTDKASSLYLDTVVDYLKYDNNYIETKSDILQPQNLYLVSYDEIKEGDWYVVPHNIEGEVLSDRLILCKAGKNFILNHYIKEKKDWWKKVIAASDKSLTKEHDDTVPFLKMRDSNIALIPESFLKQFVEANGEIDEVMVKCETVGQYGRVLLAKSPHNNESNSDMSIYKEIVKITPNNEVIIHLKEEERKYTYEDVNRMLLESGTVKKYTEKEVIQLLNKFEYYVRDTSQLSNLDGEEFEIIPNSDFNFQNWIKENLKNKR